MLSSSIHVAEKEQTDSDQRGGRRGIMGENRGRAIKEHIKRTHGQSQRGVDSRVGAGDGWDRGLRWGENGDNCT